MNRYAPHTPNAHPTPRQNPNTPSRRPSTIAELAERALENIYDEHRELKYYLRIAEKYRHDAMDFLQRGDLESAFVEFARAATLVLEKLPTHKDYHVILSAAQRRNLGLNGQDILDNLSDLKPTLVERYERWLARNPNGVDPDRTPDNRQRRPQEDDRARRAHAQREADDRLRVKEAQNQDRMVAEELEKWKRQREETWRREEEARARATGRVAGPIVTDRRAEATVAPARHAAGVSQAGADYTFSRPPAQRDGHANPQPNLSGVDRHQQQQEEMRRREEEITRRRVEEKRRQEQEGIAKRQQEAENSARAVRHNITVNTGSTISATSPASSLMPGPSPSSIYQPPTSSSLVTTPSSSLYQTPSYPLTTSATSTLRAPTAVASRPPSFLDEFSRSIDAPLIMPLENPTRYEGDSTDSETVNNPYTDWRRAGKHKQVDNSKTPTRAPVRTPSYPPPTTTTSPPPTEGGRILYPQLMSQHQKTQGYVPSLHSMFTPTTNPTVPSSLLFEPDSKGGSSSALHHSYNGRPLYSSDMLPQPSIGPNPTPAQYPYGMPQAAPHQHPQHHQQHSHSHRHHPPPQQHQQHLQQPQYPQYPGPSRPAPPVPAPSQGAPVPNAPAPNRSDPDRITLAPNPRSDAVPDLKTVNVPRECLPRFLAIAKVNTAMNRETCGLLLGKDKGHKFVVTTLLIPKQHSTSDTCTMDEEELVLQFTEERSLITLGWIHTHPSQSCFMSSVDLHTHSGFQRMLPESFAVVCAPKSNPNFGIFRLTDPPGLKTVLECKVKEAFHPHPDLPIYTDADKGHVQMKDISLEIVDLR